MDSETKLKLVTDVAEEMKARDITVLDVRGQTIVADFFVIATGTSVTHIQSIAEGIQDKLREQARERAKPEGNAMSYWVVLDYSDVVVHVFNDETREFYDLERLWSDAKVTHVTTESAEDAKTDCAEEQADALAQEDGDNL
jgi:ribosome-associated protein